MNISSTLRQAFARAIRGEFSRREGVLDISPQLRQILFVPQPLTRVRVATTSEIQNRAFIQQNQALSAGATGAGSTNIVTIGRGLWWFIWNWSMQFVGTSNPANVASFDLVDPPGNVVQLSSMNIFTGTSIVDRGEFWALIETDGWVFRTTHPAVIAGDNLATRGSVVGILQF